jgi:integrase
MASIRLTKSGLFEARAWQGGKRFSRTFTSQLKAQHWATGVECEEITPTTSAHCLTATREDPRLTLPLTRALEIYWDESASKQKGATKLRYRLAELKAEPFSAKAIQSVTSEDIRALKARELGRGCSGATVARKLSVLSAFFSFVNDEWGIAIPNPVKSVPKPTSSALRLRRLSLDELTLLQAACEQSNTPHLWEIIQLAIETAMRRSELISLTWDQVDLKRRLITLEQTKNGYQRYVPVTDEAEKILCAFREADTDRPIPISLSGLESAWKRAVSRAGLTGLRFHDLRHEGLSRWAHKLNGDVFKLAMVSGHRSLEMARRYVLPTLSELLAQSVDDTTKAIYR